MASHDNGLPSFREERMEQRKKRPAILIGVTSGIVIALTVGWLTFGKYVSLSYRAANGELPLIKADTSPDGMQPKFAGGLDVPDRDKMVYERLRQASNDIPVERLLAPAEKPLPPPVEETIAETESAELAQQDPIGALATQLAEQEALSAVVTDENGETVEVVFKTADKAPPAAIKTVPVAEETKPVKAPTAKPEEPQNTYMVQLASGRSKSAAEGEYKRFLKKYPELLANVPYAISELKSEKGTFYRLRVGSFSFKEQAQNLCNQFKAKKQECFIVK